MWQRIQADMLFNKDRFRLDGQNWDYTQQGEPTVYQGYSTHTVRGKNGETRQLKLAKGTLVSIWDEAR